MNASVSQTGPSFGHRRRWLARVGLSLGGIVLALLLAELTLRPLGISYPQLYEPDEYCGSRLRAGAAGWWSTEGRSFVRISSAGLRDREYSAEKPPDTFRVAVLGDSFAEALQVPVEQTFWAVAEQRLAACTALNGKNVEFINFGVSGYGTAQELLMLRHRVWQFEPDLVLLAVCHNDLQDNSSRLGAREPKPYYELCDGHLVLDTSFRQSPFYLAASTKYEQHKARVINSSYLLQLLKQAKMNWHLARQPRRTDPPEPGGLRDMATSNNIYAPPQSEAEMEAWQVTERLIAEMAQEVTAKGADFALMTITTPLQVYPDPAVRAAAVRESDADLFYMENRLARLGASQRFPVLTLAEPLQAAAEADGLFLHGFPNTELGSGHWNETGHGLAGRRLADWLGEMLQPAGGPEDSDRRVVRLAIGS